ncbi:MAG: AraC family transcriptional regulator [Oxalobacter formigenes]|nr:AraC family transcriptional regulator [Oxalobacter formigenes]
MKKESRAVIYDALLRIEACYFEGVMQAFPNHFYEYYVIGLVEEGGRCLSCTGKRYTIRRGSIVLFNPGDNHACVQTDEGALSYRAFHISREVMLDFAEEVSGKRKLPVFSNNVIYDDEVVVCRFRLLHKTIMQCNSKAGRENFLALLSILILNYSRTAEADMPACRAEIEKACGFIKQHFAERIYLRQLCHHVQLSQSTLLRVFVKSKKMTPYQYLETIRINEARRLLANGVPLSDAAIRTGFSDQSHFTNYFTRFIGFTPGVYRKIFVRKKGRR